MKTISLQGKQYAQVKDRIAEAHKTNEKLTIKTKVKEISTEEWIKVFLFTAKVVLDKWTYIWHSLNSIKTKKDFEKWETIAVGRALAFAWYLSDWEVASFEEMKDYEEWAIENISSKFSA